MSSSSVVIENSMRTADYNNQFISGSCEKVTLQGNQKGDMFQKVSLFKKYLLTRAQNNIGKSDIDESEVIKPRPPGALLPPMFGSNLQRRASPLEQHLLPDMRSDRLLSPMSESENSTAQLTIFYAGVINVFDNVSFDKAQAIMLLAGENSLSKPAVTEIPKGEVKSPPHQSSLTPVRKLKAGLPVARRYSLQCFLEKRRKRIVNKSPYAPLNPKDKKDNETMMNKAINKNHSDSLSPFPARLACFVPISANNNF